MFNACTRLIVALLFFCSFFFFFGIFSTFFLLWLNLDLIRLLVYSVSSSIVIIYIQAWVLAPYCFFTLPFRSIFYRSSKKVSLRLAQENRGDFLGEPWDEI